MAALCPGVQYGLSSQQNFGENKDVIFVKLTDSALRAIYDYIKNKNKPSCQGPTIKFLGNEGQLSFPSVQNGCTSFNFSMSSTADMEGPGGSFECLQQIGPPRGSLEVLGTIPYKMRVLANEDVYATTRHRMTIAEENHKNKCTREIKPNEKDIGRKVKLKQSSSNSNNNGGRVSLLSTQNNTNGVYNISNSNGRELNSLSPIPPKSSYQSNNGLISTKQSPASAATVSSTPVISSTNNTLSNGLGSNHVSSSRPQLNKPSVPDLARRPLKERLIHLLAMRPLKKVELYDRLTKEGLRERNGSSIASVLKQISFMKDNCYHLNRAMWADVKEDWPFYTESERQMLKRRKPQNLTPPGSSDGGSSCGSGQSPTSTHPESPPPPISSSSSKRPGYYDNQDGLPTKRQRISHFRKPTSSEKLTSSNNQSSSASTNNSYYHNNNQRRPITDSRDASNMNPRSRESPSTSMTNGYHTNSNGYGNAGDGNSPDLIDTIGGGTTTPTNNANNNTKINKRSSCDNHNSLIREKTFCTSSMNAAAERGVERGESRESPLSTTYSEPINRVSSSPPPPPSQLLQSSPLPPYPPPLKMNKLNDVNNERNGSPILTNGLSNSSNNNNNNKSKVKDGRKYENKVTSSSQQQQSQRLATRVSPDSQSDAIIERQKKQQQIEVIKGGAEGENNQFINGNTEFPDYLTQYITIQTQEQRRRYKSDFNADYAEYKELHGIVEKVSRRFADLETKLKKEDSSSPRYKHLKKQIYKEYNENKKDGEHQRAKRRFQYLHDKLSHIKRLVLEYDQGPPALNKY